MYSSLDAYVLIFFCVRFSIGNEYRTRIATDQMCSHISLHDKFVIIFAYSIAFVACTQRGKEEKKNKYITRFYLSALMMPTTTAMYSHSRTTTIIIASSSSSSSHSSLKSREVNRRRLKSRACFGNIDAITNSDLDFFAARRRNTTTTPMTPITQMRSRARKSLSMVLTRSTSRDEDEPPYFDRPTAFPKTENSGDVALGGEGSSSEGGASSSKTGLGGEMEKTFVGVPMTRVTMVLSNALPVMGGMVSQNVLNLVDAAMIARLGTVAVAAVGLGSTANFQCQALLQGVSSAVQAIAARSYGKSMTDVAFAEKKEIARPLNAAIVIVLFFGFPLAWWCYHNCAWFVPTYYASRDAAVASATVPYLRARLLAVPAVGINFAFRGFWNAIQQPQVYMNTLVVMHITNITVSFMLIWGVPALGVPKLGVTGAGLGTAFSVWVGTAMYIYQGFKRAKKYGFGFSLRRREGGAELDEEFSSFPTKEEIMLLIKQALPTGITNVLYASAMVFMYAIVGAISTTSVAAVNVLINLMLVLVLPCMGMGLAAGALSGRALGAGDVEDAKQWPWDVSKITAAGMSIFGLLIALFPQPILSVFLTDPEAIRVATMPLRLTGLTACGDAVSLTMQNALLGVGDVKTVALVSILAQWAVFLPIAWFSVHKLNQGLFCVWAIYVLYRVGVGMVYAWLWKRGKWLDALNV